MKTTDGMCSKCWIIWRWNCSKDSPRVSAGECFCATEGCGLVLKRTCAGGYTNHGRVEGAKAAPEIRVVDAIKIGVRRA